MPPKSCTHAPSTFEEQTLPKEPKRHPSIQQEEQPRELTLPPEDPLQEEQDPKEPLQAETLNNLAPNLQYLAVPPRVHMDSTGLHWTPYGLYPKNGLHWTGVQSSPV